MFGHVDRFLCQFQDEKTEVMTLVGFVTLVSNSSQQRCVDCVYMLTWKTILFSHELPYTKVSMCIATNPLI